MPRRLTATAARATGRRSVSLSRERARARAWAPGARRVLRATPVVAKGSRSSAQWLGRARARVGARRRLRGRVSDASSGSETRARETTRLCRASCARWSMMLRRSWVLMVLACSSRRRNNGSGLPVRCQGILLFLPSRRRRAGIASVFSTPLERARRPTESTRHDQRAHPRPCTYQTSRTRRQPTRERERERPPRTQQAAVALLPPISPCCWGRPPPLPKHPLPVQSGPMLLQPTVLQALGRGPGALHR
jgi:hypothetical protein